MSFGMDVSGAKRTRSYRGESGAGIAATAGTAKAAEEETAPVTVKVEATLTGQTYTLTVEANGQSTSVDGVEPADLADRIARLMGAVSKAVRNGELTKHRQRDSAPLGMGAPRAGRDNLRLAG